MNIDETFISNFWSDFPFDPESEAVASASGVPFSERFWAQEYVDNAVFARDVDVVRILLELAESAPHDEDRLGYLGAGPLENLLGDGDNPPTVEIVDAVHLAALSSRPFREALESIWWTDNAERTLVARIEGLFSADNPIEEAEAE